MRRSHPWRRCCVAVKHVLGLKHVPGRPPTALPDKTHGHGAAFGDLDQNWHTDLLLNPGGFALCDTLLVSGSFTQPLYPGLMNLLMMVNDDQSRSLLSWLSCLLSLVRQRAGGGSTSARSEGSLGSATAGRCLSSGRDPIRRIQWRRPRPTTRLRWRRFGWSGRSRTVTRLGRG